MNKITRLTIAVVVLSALCACRGPKGDDAPGSITSITGIIYSDDFTVTNPALTPNANVFISIGDEVSFTGLPYYMPSNGVNAYYILTRGSVQMLNCKMSGAYTYKISIVASAPAYPGSKIMEGS